jgi:hypothetical protein
MAAISIYGLWAVLYSGFWLVATGLVALKMQYSAGATVTDRSLVVRWGLDRIEAALQDIDHVCHVRYASLGILQRLRAGEFTMWPFGVVLGIRLRNSKLILLRVEREPEFLSALEAAGVDVRRSWRPAP